MPIPTTVRMRSTLGFLLAACHGIAAAQHCPALSRGVSGDRYEVNSSGLWAERIGGKWFARFVLEGSPAARAGVLAGDELVALDGAEFHPLAFASSASELTVSSDGRTTRTVEIRPIRQSLNRAFDEAARASQQILAVDGKRLGVFHVWSGSAEIRRALAEALAEFEAQQVDALLLDFRGGYGGMTETHIAPLRESAYLRSVPLVVLVDDSVRSGKELVVGVIKRDGVGTLVGARTAGAYLLGGRVPLFDDKYLLYLAVGDGPPPDIPGIGQIEGNGIEPHVAVAPCLEYCGRRDPIFDAALRQAAERAAEAATKRGG